MHVAEVSIASFRHLEAVHLGPLPAPGKTSDLVVLAGPNAGGKSSILELLAFALSNTWGWTWKVRRTFPESSFEIRFGLNDADIERIEQGVAGDEALDPTGLLPELRSRRSYLRGFDYPQGEYGSDPALHDGLHRLVSRSLSEHTRALFLRSDRYYSQQGYRREKIFESNRRLDPAYWRSIAFTLTDLQYADQMEFLIEQVYNYPRTVGIHVLEEEAGTAAGPRPSDPLSAYDKLFQELFPQYRIGRRSGDLPPDQLYISLPTGQELPFTDLSSGEQEAFFILSSFIRHDIRSSMVFIDEPELHLHPELVRRMVRIMLRIRPSNQLWLGTHAAELIDEAGRDRTYFVFRSAPAEPGEAIRASDDEGFIEQLRSMFGYAGYVGLARRLVFVEGDASSADRRVFISLFPQYSDQIRFVPLNSADNALRIHRAVLSILSEGLGHCEFFLIRDRDYLPPEIVQRYEKETSGRVFVLKRHEIENYLLDSLTISEVIAELLEQTITPDEVEDTLRDVARSLAGTVLRDMVTARLNSHFHLHDCSIGSFEANREWLHAENGWDAGIVNAATDRFRTAFDEAARDVTGRARPEEVDRQVQLAKDEILGSLAGPGWKELFPGKQVLERFGTRVGFPKGPVFINALIRKLAGHQSRVDPELRDIMSRIVGANNTGPAPAETSAGSGSDPTAGPPSTPPAPPATGAG